MQLNLLSLLAWFLDFKRLASNSTMIKEFSFLVQFYHFRIDLLRIYPEIYEALNQCLRLAAQLEFSTII